MRLPPIHILAKLPTITRSIDNQGQTIALKISSPEARIWLIEHISKYTVLVEFKYELPSKKAQWRTVLETKYCKHTFRELPAKQSA